MSTAAALGYLEMHRRPGWTWPDAPSRGAAGPWETRRARVGCLVSIRWDWRRPDDTPRWVVVAHDVAPPALGDLRVLYDASDEGRARAKVHELCGE